MYQNVFRRTNKKDVQLDIYQTINKYMDKRKYTLLDADGGKTNVDI